jgi:NADPH:quinone reductase-like Zn-dependent oxidoreductase
VIATSSSDAKLKRLRGMGASDVINYRTTDKWEKRVLELTGGAGVDHIVEIGGAGTLPKSLAAVATGGRISLIGILTGLGEVNPMPILFKSACVQGILVGSREMFEEMLRAMEANEMRPVIDRRFPFEQAPEAYRYLESGAHFGKVCITL